MIKKIAASLLSLAIVLSMFIPAAAAQSLIATNIPKSFPSIKMSPNFTTVEFWHAMTANNGVALNNMVNWFNATEGKQKKIYVKSIFQGDYDSITVKVQATLQSKNDFSLPDLVQLSSGGSFALKESPKILYMEDLINSDKGFKIKDKLNKNAMWACSYKGKQQGMPLSNSVIIMHYNATAFKEVGLDPTNPPKTIADYASYALKLTIKGKGTKNIRNGGACKVYQYHLSTWIPRQKGGTAFQFDMEEGRLGTPKKLVSATDGTMKAAISEWVKACSTGAISYQESNGNSFYMGKACMYFGSMVGYENAMNTQASLKAESRFEPMMARLPLVNADDAVGEAIGGSAVYMFDKGNTEKKNATWQFVKFLSSVDASAYWYATSGYFPLNNDAINTKYVQDILKARPAKKVPLQIRAESEKYYKFQEPSVPAQTVYNNVTGDQIVLAIQGKITVDQAVTNIQKKAETLLKTWWDVNK